MMNRMIARLRPWLLAALLAFSAGARCAAEAAPGPEEAARGLLERLLPDHAEQFRFRRIPPAAEGGCFEIQSVAGRIELRGTDAVAMCSALHWYLKHFCHASVSWCGDQLDLPDPLPAVDEPVRRVTPHRYRYVFNYCAFSYSMAWWDWPQWERMIDWMALNGINMPLAVTGQESVWREVGRRLGLSGADLAAFLPGPAYLPFGWMGCLDGWGGPLPDSWIDQHRDLGRRILARERELGMTPVLQGFTGHVPPALASKYPRARFRQLAGWCGFPGTCFVDPVDPLFQAVGRMFIEEQTRQFGTDHLYASDTFIEMSPPSADPEFLAAMGRAVYGAMKAGDPDAVWVMQGWIFFNNPRFWQPPRARALFGAVPDDRLILLDMTGDTWTKTESFYGKPWLWCLIQDFGGTVGLHAKLPRITENLGLALHDPRRGRMWGLGLIMESLGCTSVPYDLVTDFVWRSEMPELEPWVMDYVHRRYGRRVPSAENAWRLLLDVALSRGGPPSPALTRRPALDPDGRRRSADHRYDPERMAAAARELLAAAGQLGPRDTYRFDLVHTVRQVIVDAGEKACGDMVAAFELKDATALDEAGNRYLQSIRDLDALLATRKEFLLGAWIRDAKRWAADEKEARLYEWNARNQITLWGGRDSMLHDYARKQWSGLLSGFYLPRWQMFIERLRTAVGEGKQFDEPALKEELRAWEEAWTRRTEPYPSRPKGDSVAVARELLSRYAPMVGPSADEAAAGRP